MDLQVERYIKAVRQGWWVILLTAIIAVAVAVGRASSMTPQYRSTATFVISPATELVENDDFLRALNALNNDSILTTYVEVLNSDFARKNAFELLDDPDLAQNPYKVSSLQLPDSNVIAVTATGPDRHVAAELANAVGEAANAYMVEHYPIYLTNALDGATAAASPFSPTPQRDGLFAAVLGLGLGAVLAILLGELRELRRTPANRRATIEASRAASD